VIAGKRCLEWVMEAGLHRRRPGRIPPFAAAEVRRILVVRKDNIGDVLCTTPALRALRRSFPDAHLAILVSAHCRAVVAGNPDVDEVLTYTKTKHRSGLWGLSAFADLARVIRALRARRFDLAIVMGRPASRSSAWLAYVTGALWRLGYGSPALSPFPFFLNLTRDPAAALSHEVDGCLDLLASIGVLPAGRFLTLTSDPEARRAVRRRLRAAGAGEGDQLAMVHISSRRESNRWPLESFAHAADGLHDRLGLRVVVTWAPGDVLNPYFPGDDGRVEEMVGRMRTQPILLPTPTLEEFVACMSLCDFLLSADGGPIHVAAALGVPQVALFDGSGPSHWAPLSERSVVLQRGDHVREVTEEEVLAASAEVLSRWGRARIAEGVTPKGGAV